MKKSERSRVIDRRCRHLQKHKEQLLSGCAAEANHSFRVEVKKLRSFLRLLQYTQPQVEDLRLPKSFHQLYQAVGDVRSIQLQRQWVETVCKELACSVPAGYMEVLARKEKEAIKRVKEKANSVSISQLHQQLIKALPATWSKKDAEDFVLQKRRQLVKYLASVLTTDDVLHNIRKLLKNLLYVWPWIEDEMANAFPPQLLSKEGCLRLAEKLGNYQDCCVAVSLFSTPFLAGLSPGEQKRLDVIKRRCCQKKEKEKEELIVSLLLLKSELEAKLKVPQNTQPATMG